MSLVPWFHHTATPRSRPCCTRRAPRNNSQRYGQQGPTEREQRKQI